MANTLNTTGDTNRGHTCTLIESIFADAFHVANNTIMCNSGWDVDITSIFVWITDYFCNFSFSNHIVINAVYFNSFGM